MSAANALGRLAPMRKLSMIETSLQHSSAILIVEDEGIVAKDLQQRLLGLGYDAYATADSAAQAIARAGERCPDLVLMDIRIKGPLDGVQAAAVLKEKFSTAIVYLTAHTDEAIFERAKQTEPHGYLPKPVETEVLRTTIEIALYKHQLEKTRQSAAMLESRQQAELLRMSRTLRENDENVRRMLAAVTDYAIYMLDAKGHVVTWNEGAERLKGYPEAEILGKHFSAFYPAQDVANGKPDKELAHAAQFGRIEDSGWRIRKDGTAFFADVVITAVRNDDGELRGFAKVTRDITAKRESDRVRSEFVSIVSHELRTPLTSIRGALGLLQAGAMGTLPEKALGMVQIAFKNSERLTRLTNDILYIAKIESGQLPLQITSVGVAELVQESIASHTALAEKCKVRFILADLSNEARIARVPADSDRLMQVLANLLSNAAKFSPEGGAIHIRVVAEKKTVSVEVEDAGPGIPEAFKALIFEKFAQADVSSTRRVEGTGLGLSIAKGLMLAMGGEIGFDSVEGQGSTFFIELPRLEAPDHPDHAVGEDELSRRPARSRSSARNRGKAPGNSR